MKEYILPLDPNTLNKYIAVISDENSFSPDVYIGTGKTAEEALGIARERGDKMNHPKTKLLLISGLGLIYTATRLQLDIGTYAFCGGLGMSLFLTSYGYLVANSDQNEPKKLKIKNIEKVCNVYKGKNGRLYVKWVEIAIIPENGKYYAYKNNKYLGMIHHFTSTLNNEKSQAIYAKDGYVFIEEG